MIIDNQDLSEAFSSAASDFVRTEFHKDGLKINYFFRATVPTETMMEMLIRLESHLYLLGYEVEEYPSHRRSPSVQIDALS